jgi:hypothetical protein
VKIFPYIFWEVTDWLKQICGIFRVYQLLVWKQREKEIVLAEVIIKRLLFPGVRKPLAEFG